MVSLKGLRLDGKCWESRGKNDGFGGAKLLQIARLSLILPGCLFGTMEFYDFPHIGNFIIPTDEL